MSLCRRITFIFSRKQSTSGLFWKPKVSVFLSKSPENEICNRCIDAMNKNYSYCPHCGKSLIPTSNKTKTCAKCGKVLIGSDICIACQKPRDNSAKMFHPHNGRDGFDSAEISDILAKSFLDIECKCTPMILNSLRDRIKELQEEGVSDTEAYERAKHEFGL